MRGTCAFAVSAIVKKVSHSVLDQLHLFLNGF